MKKKYIFLLLSIFVIGLVAAIVYQEPWSANNDAGGFNLTNLNWVVADIFSGEFIGENTGSMNWTKLQNYPTACPASGAITTLGDSVTCSDLWVDVAGDVMTGGLNMSQNNISNISYLNPGAEDLSAGGNFAVVGNITGNQFYGEMWVHNETGYATTAIASSDVWYNLTGFNDTDMVTGQTLNGFTYDDANEHLTALVAGKYRAIFSVSTGNAGNNQEYEFAIAINNIIQNNSVIHRKLATAGDVGDTATSGFIDLAINDHIHLMTLNKDGTADIQAHAMNLNLVRIGD